MQAVMHQGKSFAMKTGCSVDMDDQPCTDHCAPWSALGFAKRISWDLNRDS